MAETVRLLAGERQSGESYRAIQACNDYLRMGPGRSLTELLAGYAETRQNAPTQRLHTLKGWSRAYAWQERAASYDARLEDAKNARAREIMESGLALAHERVNKLKSLANFLEEQMMERGENGVYHNVWVPDVKQIGRGDSAERVDIEHFNSAIISEYRATLDDIAKETGGRVNKQQTDITSGGKPLQPPVSDDGFNRALSTLADAIRETLPGEGAESGGTVGSAE